MIRIGLTGGIGSGKSVVAAIFSVMGYPCYDSDSAMKRLYTENRQLKEEMKKSFGPDIYTSEGLLDSKRLAAILFNEGTAQERISRIAYPRLAEDYISWEAAQSSSFTLFESAILLQADLSLSMDKVIAVTAPEPLRIKRVSLRSGLGEDEVRSRIARQLNDETLMAKADAVFINDAVHPLLPQIEQFIQTL